MRRKSTRTKGGGRARSFAHYTQFLLLLFTLFCYATVLLSPGLWWAFGFFSLLIPFLLVLHLLMMVLSLRHFNRLFWYHLIALIPAYFFIRATFGFGGEKPGEGDLSVLSYNVRVFNHYAHLRDEEEDSPRRMIAWAIENEADIKCFQEYFNDRDSEIYNVENRLANAGWIHSHCKAIYENKQGGEFGLAIFSRHPILYRGQVLNDNREFQNAIYADVLVGSDTIRIYNMHLQSMAINEQDIVDARRLRRSYPDIVRRLKNGFRSRAQQVDYLARHIDQCPHPVVLCGDLNEIPYSYPYYVLRRRLHNAFEEAGSGFSFSYNGLLFFLRIDQQFYSNSFTVSSFRTIREARESDHFPLFATYRFRPE